MGANKEDIESELRADWLGANWSDFGSNINLNKTSIDKDTAIYIADSISPNAFPPNFSIHRKLKKILLARSESVLNGEGIDWGTAEQIAYGSLLMEGVHVRLSGQDCERGTFSHRHSVVHDQNIDQTVGHHGNRQQFIPLSQALKNKTTGEFIGDLFQISNSNLSEFGVLGFEYGYSCESPHSLVLWEAQFGDFANGAQVIFDQFISSAETKWLRQSGMVILLPHGYEGGGPEHSSGRIERYLQMMNDDESVFNDVNHAQCNWQIVNITSPANFFHCLRRQIHRDFRKPLIAFTPKFGLRHPLVTSQLDEFINDTTFKPVINGQCDNNNTQNVKKLIFCSGKIWINLEEHRKKQNIPFDDIVITRIEEIAPFPYNAIKEEIERYPNAQIFWVQEEPKNMGPFSYVHPRLITTLKNINGTIKSKDIKYIGRKPNASPATGYPQVYKAEHNDIINQVFG